MKNPSPTSSEGALTSLRGLDTPLDRNGNGNGGEIFDPPNIFLT